jgi:uncharacterized protein
MVNKNSHADHLPERTCVICRKKMEKEALIRFIVLDNEIVFDLQKKIASRGFYVCNNNLCIEKLDKWIRKHKKQ